MLISGNSVTMGNRLWQNASPQFAIELYTVETMHCQIYENFMVNQISLEARNRVNMSSRYNVRVSQNHIDLRYKDAVEMSNHKLWIERNVCDFRNNLNTQACFSDSNTPPPGSLFNTDDSVVENNLCLGSNDTPCFLMLRNRFRRLKVRNNTIVNPVAGSDYAFMNLPSRDNGTDNNTPTDLTHANNVIAADSGVNRTWLIRSTRDDGGGFKPNLSGATPTVLGFFRRWGNISTRTYNNVNATSMADAGNSFGVQAQFVGGSDIRRMYRPLANGNLDKTGIRVGISHAGTAPNRGCY